MTRHPKANDRSWQHYQRPFVRDLAFVLACPNALTEWRELTPHQNISPIVVHSPDFWHAQYDAYRTRLEMLDTTPAYQVLTRYLLARPNPRRLGFHFEGLLSFWLTDGYTHGLHSYEVLASNVQLFEGRLTVGELDLIVYNHLDKCTEHWELAIKFFMGSYPFDPINWVGINAHDNLQRKMVHMQTKQFGATDVDIEPYGQVTIDKHYAVIKGRFFLPMNTIDFVYPDWLAPSFPMHEWCDERDKKNLTMLNTGILRRAHYVEWFSKRDFYDDKSALKRSNGERPKAGLYFEGDKPIVIYSKGHGMTCPSLNNA